MTKQVLITGVTGQDGSYLAKFLLNHGNTVHGIRRRTSGGNTRRLEWLLGDDFSRIILHYGDMTDSVNLARIVRDIRPDEIYHLAAQSHVHVSFETPEYTGNTDALGTLRMLEAVRVSDLENQTRFIRHPRPNCSATATLRPSRKQRRFVRKVLMPSQSYMRIGQRSIIVKRTTCSPVMAFCSTMKVRCEAKTL